MSVSRCQPVTMCRCPDLVPWYHGTCLCDHVVLVASLWRWHNNPCICLLLLLKTDVCFILVTRLVRHSHITAQTLQTHRTYITHDIGHVLQTVHRLLTTTSPSSLWWIGIVVLGRNNCYFCWMFSTKITIVLTGDYYTNPSQGNWPTLDR